MRTILTALVGALALTTLATSASAAPILTASHVVLPSGNIQWTVFFDNDDGAALASAFDLEFTGDIVHTLVAGAIVVDNHADAVAFNGFSGFDMHEDTWVDADAGATNPFVIALPSTFVGNNGGAGGTAMDPPGLATFGTAVYAAWGTAGGSPQGPAPSRIAQIVVFPTPGAPLSVTGLMARGGGAVVPVNQVFTTSAPEPAIALLLGVACVATLARRRRG